MGSGQVRPARQRRSRFRAHSLTHSLTHSLIHSLTDPPTHPLTHPPTHPLIHSLTHSPTHPPTHLLTHSLAHPPTHSLTHSLPPSLPSESAELVGSAKDMGKKINIQLSWCGKRLAQEPIHGMWTAPHDGQQWSMMNEKHFLKMTGPSLQWTTWAPTRLHMEIFLIKITSLPC